MVAAGLSVVPERRFPPPWSVDETDACFIVRDANGQALATSISRMNRADGRLPVCSRATRPGASPPTSPSCRRCCALADPILPPLYDRKRCFDRT